MDKLNSQMENRIIEASKNLSQNLEYKTGVQSSLREEEMKSYMKEVISGLNK